MATLWQKNQASLKAVMDFTTGNDREMDVHLAPFDVLGSMAHIRMLASINLLTKEEHRTLHDGLKDIYHQIAEGQFRIDDGIEDVHSQIEFMLTEKFGDVGKKIHSGRSRNDQALVDIKLFIRDQLRTITENMQSVVALLLTLSDKHKDKLLPGYTHFQPAMPSSFGLWFGAYAESLVDDLMILESAYRMANKNPLGSAAGYGASFPLDRQLTTQLLGFEALHYNVVYAQMCRGKTERIVASAMGNIAGTLAKWAMDACLFMSPNYGFISFPDELTTGSSIMPHKKNPDVLEMIRAQGNYLQSVPNTISAMTANLPSGYHRDMQLIKETLFPSFAVLNECLLMTHLMLSHIHTKDNLLEDNRYLYLFSVEEVNKRVLQGIPFRDAYKEIGNNIEAGNFSPDKIVSHTHAGSIGNLNLEDIKQQMNRTLKRFPFERVDNALEALLSS